MFEKPHSLSIFPILLHFTMPDLRLRISCACQDIARSNPSNLFCTEEPKPSMIFHLAFTGSK